MVKMALKSMGKIQSIQQMALELLGKQMDKFQRGYIFKYRKASCKSRWENMTEFFLSWEWLQPTSSLQGGQPTDEPQVLWATKAHGGPALTFQGQNKQLHLYIWPPISCDQNVFCDPPCRKHTWQGIVKPAVQPNQGDTFQNHHRRMTRNQNSLFRHC